MIESVLNWLRGIFKSNEEQYLEEAKDISELECRMISLGNMNSGLLLR